MEGVGNVPLGQVDRSVGRISVPYFLEKARKAGAELDGIWVGGAV